MQHLPKPWPPPPVSLSLLVEDNEKGKRKGSISLCLPKISVTLCLPWMKLVLLSQPWPKIEKGRRKDALSAFLTLFSVQEKNKRRNSQGQPFTGKGEKCK